MIINCPNCTTRFLVYDEQIEPNGRTVRCGRCQHTWFQDYEPVEDDGSTFADVLSQQEAMDQPVSQQLPAIKTKKSAAPLWRVAAALAVVWVCLLIALFAAQGPIAAQWPASARLYSALGMPVAVPGEGLALTRVASTIGAMNGRSLLIVHGTIDNPQDKALPLPNILIEVQDDDRRALTTLTHEATAETVAAGGSHAFYDQQWLDNEMAARVLVRFADKK